MHLVSMKHYVQWEKFIIHTAIKFNDKNQIFLCIFGEIGAILEMSNLFNGKIICHFFFVLQRLLINQVFLCSFQETH